MTATAAAPSQIDAILAWLTAGYSLTPLEALERFQCMRLGARVHELQERGVNIVHEFVKVPSGKRVMRYSLAKESPLTTQTQTQNNANP